MTEPEALQFDYSLVLERFPDDVEIIKQFIGRSETFTSACEDYTLAKETLKTLENLGRNDQHADQLTDYRTLIAELERELAVIIQNSK